MSICKTLRGFWQTLRKNTTSKKNNRFSTFIQQHLHFESTAAQEVFPENKLVCNYEILRAVFAERIFHDTTNCFECRFLHVNFFPRL
jgi:hypothetical protein